MLIPTFVKQGEPMYDLGDIYQALYQFFGKANNVQIHDNVVDGLPKVNGKYTITRKFLKQVKEDTQKRLEWCNKRNETKLGEYFEKYPCVIGVWDNGWTFVNATSEYLGLEWSKTLYVEV